MFGLMVVARIKALAGSSTGATGNLLVTESEDYLTTEDDSYIELDE